jgi:effector-binding domain-containing protein
MAALGAAGAHPVGPSVAYYTPAPDQGEDAVWVHATFPVSEHPVPGLQAVQIPAGEVASLIHQGSMDGIDATYQELHRWVREQGFTPTGDAREVYLEIAEDPNDWVTEVQLDFTR